MGNQVKHDHLIHRGYDEKILGVTVRTRQYFFQDYTEAKKLDDSILIYLVCSYCHGYVPENHPETKDWLIRGHESNKHGRFHHSPMVYRSLDPEKDFPTPHVHCCLSPMEQLAILTVGRPK